MPSSARSTARLPIALALASLALAAAAAGEPRCLDDADVCLDATTEGETVHFRAVNHEAAPYSVRVVIGERHNLDPSAPLPFRAVLEPGEERELGTLAPHEAKQPTRYTLRWSAALGDARARHDDGVRYGMPFGGKQPSTLSQGVGGEHTGASTYAFDFAMPWGTPVLAARAGRVVRVVDGYTAGSPSRDAIDRANRVDVLHADGTLATYAHLRQKAAVRVGQTVATGDTLGWSGDTGFATGPHLHFMVWKREVDLGWHSLPVRFQDDTPAGFVPQVGVAYAPGCASSGAGCAEGVRPTSESVPAHRAEPEARALRREDGACACPNGAVIHVALPCRQVCGR